MFLPTDASSNTKLTTASLEEFQDLKKSVISTPNDLRKWDALFSKFDETITKVQNNVSTEFKDFVNVCYTELLDIFPYLVEYWKRWTVISYKFDGLKASIEIMSKSVDSCQFSLELWEDYLNALMIEKDESYGGILELSIKLNGHHFNSQNLWDKYLEYHRQKGSEMLPIYLKLIRIPLYKYARYYNEFTEINKNYTLEQIMDTDTIEAFLNKYGKTEATELSQFEVHQIIDEFSYEIFTNSQSAVTRKWEFEKQLTINQIAANTISNTETQIWIDYLDSEIKNMPEDTGTVVNVFERSLIPNCFNEKIWLKYLAYLNRFLAQDKKVQVMDAIYKRCINKFLPLDTNFIRFNYCKFLIRHDKFDIMNDYILDLISFFSGKNNYNLTLQQGYVDTIECFLTSIKYKFKDEQFKMFLKNILDCFLQQAKLAETPIDSKYITLFFNKINSQSILVVSKLYLEELLASDDKTEIYSFFAANYSNAIFKNSVSFWRFYVEYEGLVSKNFNNLNKIVNFISRNTTLPKLVINKFIHFRYNLFACNYQQFKDEVNDDSLITHDIDLSTSVTNKDFWISYQMTNKDLKGQFDNPGLIGDKPEITNKINDFSIFDEETTGPLFRNLEKVNMSFHN